MVVRENLRQFCLWWRDELVQNGQPSVRKHKVRSVVKGPVCKIWPHQRVRKQNGNGVDLRSLTFWLTRAQARMLGWKKNQWKTGETWWHNMVASLWLEPLFTKIYRKFSWLANKNATVIYLFLMASSNLKHTFWLDFVSVDDPLIVPHWAFNFKNYFSHLIKQLGGCLFLSSRAVTPIYFYLFIYSLRARWNFHYI